MKVHEVTDEEAAMVREQLRRIVDRVGSQSGAAKLTGVSQQTISHILKGNRPGFAAMRRVAKAADALNDDGALVQQSNRGRPSLSPAEAGLVLDALWGLLNDRCGGNISALARDLGLSQSGVSQLLSGKNDPSLMTAERAAALMGVSIVDLLYSDTAFPCAVPLAGGRMFRYSMPDRGLNASDIGTIVAHLCGLSHVRPTGDLE